LATSRTASVKVIAREGFIMREEFR
jgi:hypothetical protein